MAVGCQQDVEGAVNIWEVWHKGRLRTELIQEDLPAHLSYHIFFKQSFSQWAVWQQKPWEQLVQWIVYPSLREFLRSVWPEPRSDKWKLRQAMAIKDRDHYLLLPTPTHEFVEVKERAIKFPEKITFIIDSIFLGVQGPGRWKKIRVTLIFFNT